MLVVNATTNAKCDAMKAPAELLVAAHSIMDIELHDAKRAQWQRSGCTELKPQYKTHKSPSFQYISYMLTFYTTTTKKPTSEQPNTSAQAQMQMQNIVGFSKNRLRAFRGVVYASATTIKKNQPSNQSPTEKRTRKNNTQQNKLHHTEMIWENQKEEEEKRK